MEHDAFEALIKPLLEPAYRYALRLCGRSDLAMDLVQDASVRAFRHFGTFREGTNFKAWFMKILTHRYYAVKAAENRQRTVSLEDAPDLFLYDQSQRLGHSSDPDPVAWVFAQVDSAAIQAALDRLPDEYRTVCVMHLMSDMSYEEVAGALEIPIGTVRSRLHRGRRQLQTALWHVAEERGLVPENS